MPSVLVVDDEVAIVRVASAVLASVGFRTFSAFDGQEAIEMARLSKPDVVVSGIVMPCMDGFSAAEEILSFHPTCAFLFVTGAARYAEIKERAGRLRNFGFLFDVCPKPFDGAGLIEKVRMLSGSA